jgi:hypothetical protein
MNVNSRQEAKSLLKEKSNDELDEENETVREYLFNEIHDPSSLLKGINNYQWKK